MEPLSDEQVARLIAIALDHARQGETTELAEFFDHGLPLDVTDAEGNTAVMLAAYHGRIDTVRMLVDRGANVNLTNHRNQTPIAGALFKGEDEVVHLLRAAGADLDAGVPTARQAADMFGRTHLLNDPEQNAPEQ